MKEQARQKVGELVERFRYNLDVYKRSTYNEAQVRREFIDPFFEALGWDVSNKQGYAEQYKEVIHEDTIKVGRSTKAPDYSFRIGGQRKFFVEAKKPAVNIKEDVNPSYQLRRYAWSAKLPLSVVTDFEEFSVFDCRVKPNPNDKPGVGRIAYYTFEDYLDKFDEIYDVFSREAVLKGSFDRYAESTKGKKGTAEVDSEFLKEIESWRELLAKNIALRNPEVSIYELNYAVQKIIDRIIFLRICEDRGIEPYGQLQTKAESGEVYKHLVNHFKLAESKYDSGIFDFDVDRITSTLRIDDRVLKAIIQSLYYPKSPYEFSVLGVEILGNVYEQFLGKVIRLTAGHQAKVETKPEVKKAGGVYYTPQYIVDYIVKNTVGKLVEGKTPEEIAAIKILDPACGSGSFLIGAYTYLLQYHLDWYTNNNPKKHKEAVFQVRENEWYLTTGEKKRILLNNIFGVDIDPQAVEVTKLSLLLKVLEHESRESIDQQVKLGLEGVLPNLAGNIKCGNSLIGPDFYDAQQQQATLFDEEEMRRINVFDWDDDVKGFGEIMKRGGFDCVIGNPPYLKIHHLVEQGSKVLDYFNDKYESSGSGGYDIYIVFVERGTKLLRENGKFGFILPHKFFNASYGKWLRNYISREKLLSEVVHFKDKQVFENVSTYTCLLFLSKSNQKEFDYLQIPEDCSPKEFIGKIRSNRSSFVSAYDLTGVTEKPWFFVDRKYTKLMQKLSSGSKTLGELTTNIFKGFDTGADKTYFMEYIDEEDTNFILFSKELQKPVKIEKRLMKKSLKGKQINRFYSSFKELYVLFPYNIINGKVSLIEESILKEDFLNGYNYLKSLKSVLERRNKGRMKGTKWYAFTYPRNMLLYEKPKIFTPYNAFHNTFCFDGNGEYYFTTGVAGAYGLLFAPSPCDIKYFLGVLNSSIVNFFIKQIGTCLQGGYYSYEKRFIEKLPIRTIDFSNPAEKAQHDKLVALVENMLELQKKYHEARMERDKELYERQIKIVDAQIDRLVYDLYGLTDEEVKIIERA